MSAPRQAVRVTIGGEEYAVKSEHPPDYTRAVAAHVDAAVAKVRDAMPLLEPHKQAVLAALAITDELFQARQGDADQARRLSLAADEVARLLPPAKRGLRAPPRTAGS